MSAEKMRLRLNGGINVDALRDEIWNKYQELCREAQLGGASTLDELADVTGMLSEVMAVVDDLASAIFKLQDSNAEILRRMTLFDPSGGER